MARQILECLNTLAQHFHVHDAVLFFTLTIKLNFIGLQCLFWGILQHKSVPLTVFEQNVNGRTFENQAVKLIRRGTGRNLHGHFLYF